MNLKRLLRILAAVLAIILASAVSASNATLPFSVLQANTIYIDNESGFAELATIAYMELSRWGRFEPAESRAKADLMIVLTGSSYVRVVPAKKAPTYDPKKSNLRPAELPDAAPNGFTRVTLQEAKSGKTIWSGLTKTDGPRVKGKLLDCLREAYEQTEKVRYKK